VDCVESDPAWEREYVTYNRLNEIAAIAEVLQDISEQMEEQLGDLPYSRVGEFIRSISHAADTIADEVRYLQKLPAWAKLEPDIPTEPDA
jgi:hypothetical protein